MQQITPERLIEIGFTKTDSKAGWNIFKLNSFKLIQLPSRDGLYNICFEHSGGVYVRIKTEVQLYDIYRLLTGKELTTQEPVDTRKQNALKFGEYVRSLSNIQYSKHTIEKHYENFRKQSNKRKWKNYKK